MDKYEKIVPIIIVILIFMLPGIVISYIGLNFQIENYNFMKNAEETKAKITRITTDRRGNEDNVRYKVFVDYLVNGNSYGGELHLHVTGMKEGDEVSIYYERENPKNFKSTIIAKWGGLFLAFGGIIFLVIGSKLLLAARD